MEELTRLLASCEFASPLYFWIASALVLLLIFFPLPSRRRGLALDLNYWRRRVEFKRERVWVLSLLVAITSILMTTVLADPQMVTKQSLPIYGKPVMAVVDVSGSMEYKGSPGEKVTTAAEEASNFERARGVFYDILHRDSKADFGLLLYSTKNYVARYFAYKNELLKDTLENTEEVSFISTGTQTTAALAKARFFLSEKIQAKEKAIVLISDLHSDLEGLIEMAEEMESALWAGIKVYVIVIGGERGLAYWAPRRTQKEVRVVGMYDEYGIDQICAEISAMESSLIGEQEILSRVSLVPFLIPPVLGLITLCLILSGTRFRKIP